VAALSRVLRSLENGFLAFRCPGCKRAHMVGYANEKGPRWIWDGNAEFPTFTPSVLVTYPGPDAGLDGAPPAVCHSFVRSGRIEFLGDCTHALKGQTVDLPEFPE
jgi:hypothetical protein